MVHAPAFPSSALASFNTNSCGSRWPSDSEPRRLEGDSRDGLRTIKKKARIIEGVERDRRALPEGDKSAKEADTIEDEVDKGDWDGVQEVTPGGSYDDNDNVRERVEGNRTDIRQEGEQEEILGGGLVFHVWSAKEEDYHLTAEVDMAKWDALKVKKRAILQGRVENDADRRYMEKVLQRERRELSRLEKEEKEVGNGGRGAKRWKKLLNGDELGGETFY
ncbi:hypothetical protein JCM11641_003117 [Rhodosporidiobolus odoratus]